MTLQDSSRKSEKKKQNNSRRLVLALTFAIITPLIAPRAEEKSSESSIDQTLTSSKVQAASAVGAAVLLSAGAISLSSRCANYVIKSIRKLEATPSPLGNPGSPLPRNAIAENIQFTRMRKPFRARDYETSLFMQKRLAPFEKLRKPQLEAFLREEFSKAIESGYGLLSPRELQDFHEAVRDFISQGGHFVMDQALDPQQSFGAFFYVSHEGELAVNLPYVDILKSAVGDPEKKQVVVGATLHEIRHYVTYIRVAKSLEKKGLTHSEARTYLPRLEDQPDRLAYHIDQLEQEARAIERRALPHTIENDVQAFLYADMEALQRWTMAYLSHSLNGSLENLSKQPVAIRLADRIASQTAEYFTNLSDGRELPGLLKYNLQVYVTLSKKDKSLGREVLFEVLVHHMFQGIKGRLDSSAEASLKSLILTRFQSQRRSIDSAIQKLLKVHPEIKPSDIE